MGVTRSDLFKYIMILTKLPGVCEIRWRFDIHVKLVRGQRLGHGAKETDAGVVRTWRVENSFKELAHGAIPATRAAVWVRMCGSVVLDGHSRDGSGR